LPSEVWSWLVWASRVLLGVREGRIVASTTPPSLLIGDADGRLYCAHIGRVVLPARIRDLGVRAPWLRDEHALVVPQGWL
jgi:hypothetical protein